MIALDESRFATYAARMTEQRKREDIPERPVHWRWLHGPVMPEVSPGEAKDRTARTGKWALR